jgi:ketosteroid isomerase-like protein
MPDETVLRAKAREVIRTRKLTLSILLVLITASPLATIAHSQDGEKRAIIRVIQSISSAINDADLPLVLVHIAEDAVIDSRIAQGKVSKQKYADAMARAFKRREIISFESRNIRVTMVDATRATVLATISGLTLGHRYIYDHEWKLEKREGLWLVVETAYRTKPLEPVKPLEIA